MILASGVAVAQLGAGERILALLSQHGSAVHPYATGGALLRSPASTRNLADATAFLCSLHGRSPGLLAHAAAGASDGAAREWLNRASAAFAPERGLLARLSVEVGSPPSTPGSTGAECTLRAQRQSMDRLATSERIGCGLGAAIALVADWAGIRFVLNTAAGRFGLLAPLCALPEEAELAGIANTLTTSPAVERAILFGAEQLLLQHRGLWDILEARALART